MLDERQNKARWAEVWCAGHTRRGDAFALMAFELGFDTVQVGDGTDGGRAGIPSLQIVHLSPRNHGPSERDRPPRFSSGRPRIGACGVGIPLRRGWQQERICKCDPTKAILNWCEKLAIDRPPAAMDA